MEQKGRFHLGQSAKAPSWQVALGSRRRALSLAGQGVALTGPRMTQKRRATKQHHAARRLAHPGPAKPRWVATFRFITTKLRDAIPGIEVFPVPETGVYAARTPDGGFLNSEWHVDLAAGDLYSNWTISMAEPDVYKAITVMNEAEDYAANWGAPSGPAPKPQPYPGKKRKGKR
jgi:hypothetical protein